MINEHSLPNEAVELVNILSQTSKNETYFVGGCVRDMIMNREPHDYDICTVLTPDQVKETLNNAGIKTYDSGIAYGTITAIGNSGEEYEITTFRKETGYSDGRHPDSVAFAKNIEDDLARRDFSINAIAYNPVTKEYVDPFNGIEAIAYKKIKCVGMPEDRFNEDALRILRAMRFAVVLGFELSGDTLCAAKKLAPTLKLVSKERKTEELRKLLTSGKPISKAFHDLPEIAEAVIPELGPCIGFDLKNPLHHHDVYSHLLSVVDNCDSNTFEAKLAALLHDIGKPKMFKIDDNGIGRCRFHAEEGVRIAERLFDRESEHYALTLTNKEKDKVLNLIKYHDSEIVPGKIPVKKFITSKVPEEYLPDFFALKRADVADHIFPSGLPSWAIDREAEVNKLLEEMKAEGRALKLSDLDINGNDIMNIGFKGSEIGKCLTTLLNEVIEERIENKKESLLMRASDMYFEIGGEQIKNDESVERS